jgi:hypothetical protein
MFILPVRLPHSFRTLRVQLSKEWFPRASRQRKRRSRLPHDLRAAGTQTSHL